MNEKSKFKVTASILATVVLAGVAIWLFIPGRVELSDRGYQLSMALATACNLERIETIGEIGNLINTSLDSGEISEVEKTQLDRIIAIAKSGDWKTANRQVKRLMNQQVKRVR